MFKRTFEDVEKSYLLPYNPLAGEGIQDSMRLSALMIVLMMIPEEAFKKLVDSHGETWNFYVPQDYVFGEIMPIPAHIFPPDEGKGLLSLRPYARQLFLSQKLERMSLSFVEAVVAHELAHLVLDHDLWPGEKREVQEAEAWQLIKDWGFNKQEKIHAAYYKSKDTKHKRLIERMKRDHPEIFPS